ncbi:hypothetical protein OG455_41455 [Kitasatospora sp. NBC_01287]|uniref:hypothetical protein n=1 Tax=Kitasatospora sp. NBC_01287 TaxID=2903573 RepID=UPI002256E85E|nr:hypothetical protein [Kitasatospora sp. NBC_01287]MCX4750951.1 hypothetical protein [Kitasatospora sp. NBC_01287]MCX4751798.1 hypothetical protein [Kitasatospora sp. NBC_01287]MCX4751910.1 hypothetical protein [Kitasatospora sp. NBC_01287]
MNTTAPRPTENAAIGLAMRAKPPRLNLSQLLLDRAAARHRLDRYGDWLLGLRIQRTLAGTSGLGE